MSRILFISDLHANREALDAVLKNVEHDEIFCMGGLVDYGPEPAECIDWARRNGIVTVRGNHDNAVAFKVDCGCGYAYKRLSVATRDFTWSSIGDNDMKFLAGLPMLVEKYDLVAVCRKISAKMPHAAGLEAILRRGN
jgi:predicted phosphodiesterase